MWLGQKHDYGVWLVGGNVPQWVRVETWIGEEGIVRRGGKVIIFDIKSGFVGKTWKIKTNSWIPCKRRFS